MKTFSIILAISTALFLMSALASAQPENMSTSPPLSQPLVREGDFAIRLADSLRLGVTDNETEAESILGGAGIAPINGWIADYPITPDIVGELQTAISETADSGGLSMSKDEALNAFHDLITQYNLAVNMDASGRDTGDTSGVEYPDSTVMDNYYYDEGPPVVTYYAPPPDYAYLYSWVSYPFWWWNFWFPGFFVLADFDVRGHGHGHGHGHDEGHFSNHFRNPRTGKMSRIDPASRYRVGTLPAGVGTRWTSPSSQRGAQSIVTTPSRAPSARTRAATSGRTSTITSGQTRPVTSGQTPAGTSVQRPTVRSGREFRGYGSPRSSVGTRSSVFDRSVNTGVERSSGDRGFQSRTNAGQVPSSGSYSGGVGRGGAAGGSVGGGGGRGVGGGGGGSRGGGIRR